MRRNQKGYTAETAPAEEFIEALRRNEPAFGVRLSSEHEEQLGHYYRIVRRWNARLHLVAPCTPEEFATRHVLESLMALPFLSKDARVIDVGSGAGLPIIPCLILRPDLQATLVEASQKKAVFLSEALHEVGASGRGHILGNRFEDLPLTDTAMEADFVTCRALERFTEKFLKLSVWSPPSSTLLFFGGPTLQAEIEKAGLSYQSVLIPQSERRFLFIIEPSAPTHK
jgi:16S rRNA (guanine527-N7)-methyltransferase